MTHVYVHTKLVNGLSLVAKGSTTSERREGGRERNDISCTYGRLMRVYLDKVPARNRFKSESVPTMKGVKRCCASALVAIKRTCKTIIVACTRPRINSEVDDGREKREKDKRERRRLVCGRRRHRSTALLKEPRERAVIMGARYDPRDALMRLHVNAKNRGC